MALKQAHYFRVDQDSALHNDLQILKEKEGSDFILLNFSFKVSLAFQCPSPPPPPSLVEGDLPLLVLISFRIIFPLTRRSSGLCLRFFLGGEYPGSSCCGGPGDWVLQEDTDWPFLCRYVLGGGAICMELLTKQVSHGQSLALSPVGRVKHPMRPIDSA